ncbi:MAG TPA: EamA family transporter, partial [Thermoanaerobaculia bacterium]|nr:EamA family transporter [Thermoanaerobaculia bacterium]
MNPRRLGILYIVIAALLWSTGGIGIKGIDDAALKVTFYRSVFAAITLFVLFRRDVTRFPRTPAFFAAIVAYAMCLTTFVFATRLTTAANAIFLQY